MIILDYEMPKYLTISFFLVKLLHILSKSQRKRKMKKGYLGFITNISNELISLSLLDPYIKEQLKRSFLLNFIESKGYFLDKNWVNYQETTLKKINSNNDRNLGGFDPRKTNNLEMNLEVLFVF